MNNVDDKTPHGAIREWINHILEIKGWNPARLAKEAGVSPSTISRALNDERFVLTTKTIDKIKKAASDQIENGLMNRMASAIGFEILKEPELEKLQAAEAGKFYQELDQNDEIEFYTYRGVDLALCGIYPGDMLAIDRSDVGSLCKRTDIALATVKSFEGDRKAMVLRYFDPPYLLTKNLFPPVDSKPLPVDGDTVSIIGRVVAVVRRIPR